MTSPYTSVDFCAYIVSMILIVEKEVGDPERPWYVGGKYVGLDDPEIAQNPV